MEETNTSVSLETKSNEHPNIPHNKAGLKEINDINDNVTSTLVKDKTEDAFKERKAVPFTEKNRRGVLNKEYSTTSAKTHSRTIQDRNDVSTSTIRQPVKATEKRRTYQSRSETNDKNKPVISQSEDINDNSVSQRRIQKTKANRQENNSQPTLAQASTVVDKAMSTLRTRRPKSKIKEDINILQPSKTHEKRLMSKAKTTHSDATTKGHESESNVPRSPIAHNVYVPKTMTCQSKEYVKGNKSETDFIQSPTSIDTTDAFEIKNSLLKSNRNEDKTETKDYRSSRAIDKKDISRKKSPRSKVKVKEKQITPILEDRSNKETDSNFRNKFEVEADYHGGSYTVEKQELSGTKDKHKLSSSSVNSKTVPNKDNSESCVNKSNVPPRSKVTKSTVNKSDRSSFLSSNGYQLMFSKENKESMKEKSSLEAMIKSSKAIKQMLPLQLEDEIINETHHMKSSGKERTKSGEGKVIKCKFESQEFSKAMILTDEILGNISTLEENKNVRQPCEKIPIVKISSVKRNYDADIGLDNQVYRLEDQSSGVKEEDIPLLFAKDTSNATNTADNEFDVNSTDKNEENISRFHNFIEGEIEKGNTDPRENHYNDKIKSSHKADKKNHKIAWNCNADLNIKTELDNERVGHTLQTEKSVLQEIWDLNDKEGENENRPIDKRQNYAKCGPLEGKDMVFLKSLLNKEACVILEELLKNHSLLDNYTENVSLDDSFVDLFLQVLLKAFTTNDYVILLQLFEYLKTSGFFDEIFDYLTLVIIRIKTKQSAGKYIQRILENLVTILLLYHNRNPSSFLTFRKPHVIIGRVIEELANIGYLDDEISEKYQQLTESIKVIDKARKKAQISQADLSKPHDDYRHYSIFPTVDEITGTMKPYLRPIKTFGCYEDLHDYLDVHFRLLREDFVGPLREGIIGLIKIMSAYKGQASKSKHLKDLDIKIYENVRVISPAVTQQGLCYKMKLKMTGDLKDIMWDVSKRLIFGSMVCLTDTDFTEFFLATVVEREAKEIKRGYFVIHFETQAVSTKSLLNRVFIMTETSGYFEAYRHVLSSLQTIQQEDLPFERHIVNCERTVGYPKYLKRNMTFDLRPLLNQNVKLKANRYFCKKMQGDVASNVEFTPNSSIAKSVHLTDYKNWPSKELLHMNESQYLALQSALTREFAIIQGPPGTGKTYIGLQIVKVLLHNKSIWKSTGKTTGPMLIVCYTNHALDQFLEGILKFFAGDIIRVGARSSSTDLEEFNLKTYRQMDFKKGTKLARLQYEKRDARRSMISQSEYVQELAERIQTYQSDIVDEQILSEEIGDRLLDSLINGYKGKKKRSNFSYIVKWLGIEQMKNKCMKEIRNCQGTQRTKYVKVEDDTSRTIKDRMMDIDEDFRFSSNKRKIIGKIRDDDIAFYVKDPVVGSRKKRNMPLEELTQAKQFYKIFKAVLMCKITDEDVMSQEEANTIQNLWRINHQTKWRLYRLWIKNKCAKLYAKIEEKKVYFEAAAKSFKDACLEVDKAIMEKAVVIGMTTSGAARYQSVLRDIGPRIIIVEEAAEVLEAHIITTLSRECEHLVLIGDHKQLRPNPTVYELVVKYNLDISLFERMVKNDIDFNCLELQHRMRPEIASIMRHIYPELKDHEDVKSYPNVKGVSTNLFLVNHAHMETCGDEIKSYSNYREAEYAVALCRYLLLQGYGRHEITILTTYTGQLMYLRQLMPIDEFDGVHVTVVDNYQGEENKIVILSLVRSNTESKIGFLKTENRICVALSRAKVGLYIIGNFDHLASQSSLWERITKDMSNKGFIGEGLVLYCQNHPDDKAIVAKVSEDFQKAPEGGCLKMCDTRLECGHKCVRHCHVTDQEHKENKCMKSCNKILCDLGHKCPDICSEECSPCSVIMAKIIPSCGHTQTVPCAIKPEEFCCQESCSKFLECGHLCKEKCGEAHTSKCCDKVDHTWPCGHSTQIMCWETKSKKCPKPCGIQLKCMHKCSGTCGSCFMGRVHQQCKHQSTVTNLCGHKSSFLCQQDLPCPKDCENRCIHRKCAKKCGELCTPCNLPCSWQCSHKHCTKRCSEMCNRTPCNFPCEKILKCKHSCVGLCGETCPNVCSICNKKKFNAMTFGKKHEQSERFVLLEDCGHLVEFRSMDAIVDKLITNTKALSCPKCKTSIKNCLRYGNTIKAFMKKFQCSKSDVTNNFILYNRLKSSICTVTFDNPINLDTYAEIEEGRISGDIAKRNFPSLFYKVLCKRELGNRLETLHKSQFLQSKQLLTVEKQWHISEEIVSLIQRIQDMERALNELEDSSLVSFLHQLVIVIVQPRDVLTDQESDDFRQEIQRGKAYLKILKLKKLALSSDLIAKVRDDLRTMESVLLGSARFTYELERNVNGCIEHIDKEINLYVRKKNI